MCLKILWHPIPGPKNLSVLFLQGGERENYVSQLRKVVPACQKNPTDFGFILPHVSFIVEGISQRRGWPTGVLLNDRGKLMMILVKNSRSWSDKSHQLFDWSDNSHQLFDWSDKSHQVFDWSDNSHQLFDWSDNSHKLFDQSNNSYKLFDWLDNIYQPFDQSDNSYQLFDWSDNSYQLFDQSDNIYQLFDWSDNSYQLFDWSVVNYMKVLSLSLYNFVSMFLTIAPSS